MSRGDLALVAGLVVLWTAISSRAEAIGATAPMVFTIGGLALGGEHALRIVLSASSIRVTAELTLVLIPFSDAARVRLTSLQNNVGLPARLLGIGLPLTVVVGALFAQLVFRGFGIWLAVLVAACLAPTDAGLGAGRNVTNPSVRQPPSRTSPKSCLGAVIVVAAAGLIEPDAWRSLWLAGRRQVIIGGVTTIGVITVGVLNALIIAVVLSIVDVISRTQKPHDAVLGWVEGVGRYGDAAMHPSARLTPGVVVYRLDERLIFTSATYVKGRVHEAVNGAPTPTKFLVFDAEGVDGIDASGVEMLEELHGSLVKGGILLVVARLKGPTASRFDATGLTATIGKGNFYGSVREAVAACSARIGDAPPPE